VRDLLFDGALQVMKGRVAQAVHVQKEIVQVEPFGAIRGTGRSDRFSRRSGQGSVAVKGLPMVLVVRAVVLAALGPDQRRVQLVDGIVGGFVGGGRRIRRQVSNLTPQVGMDRARRILKLADRAARHVLHDRLQAPARTAARRPLDRRLLGHGPGPAASHL
jgi:hypothetical protein